VTMTTELVTRRVDLPTVPPRAREASERLTITLAKLKARGRRPKCLDPENGHLWLSDIATERALAAELCRGCLAMRPCLEFARANRERFGVFGGVDMAKKNRAHRVNTNQRPPSPHRRSAKHNGERI
jgi:Transcription factor WhiB